MNILVYSHKRRKSQKFQNEFQWTTKHVFLARLFLAHVTQTLKVRHFEPIEHSFSIKWLTK